MTADKSKPPINVDYFEDLTEEIPPANEILCDQIGDRIRRLREEKELPLSKLSQLTGFTEKELRDIEANLLCPQLGTVIKLSKALDSALQQVIANEGRQTHTITRRTERKIVSRSGSSKGGAASYSYMSLAPEVKGRHMEALLVQLEQSADPEDSMHAGEEFIYVLDGTVVLKIGAERYELEVGDSAYYLSTTPHALSAKNGRAMIIAVIYSQ